MLLPSIPNPLKPARPPEPTVTPAEGSPARSAASIGGRQRLASSSSSSRSSPPPLLLLAYLALLLALFGAPSAVQAQNTTAVVSAFPHLAVYGLPAPSNASGLLLSLASNLTASLAGASSAAQQPTVFLSFALCSADSTSLVFVSTSSAYPAPSAADLGPLDGDDDSGSSGWASDADKGVWFVEVSQGLGTWQGTVTDGLWIGIWDGAEGESIEIGFSTAGFVQSFSSALPTLGDTTSSHLLLQTPTFANLSQAAAAQAYPNYTLPPPPFAPTAPTSPNTTVFVLPTDQLNATLVGAMGRSACWVRTAASALNASVSGVQVVDRQVELSPNGEGWREVVVLANSTAVGAVGLAPGANYTLFVLTPSDEALGDAALLSAGAGTLAGPIWATMKRDDFPCPLAYNLPSCPSIAHAVAMPSTSPVLTALPTALEDRLAAYLASFALTVGTWPCGRADNRYSMVADCEDCWVAYRDWLCAVSLPRCGEAPLSPSTASTPGAEPTLIARNASSPRSPDLSTADAAPSYAFSELPPCLSLCYRVDRLCPVFVGFRCPLAAGGRDGLGTARHSYAVGEGEMGVAASRKREGVDRAGVAWCERGGDWTN